ncbi:MAG: hypothetical protein ABL995_17635 [Bryobacteraceae bacterium]
MMKALIHQAIATPGMWLCGAIVIVVLAVPIRTFVSNRLILGILDLACFFFAALYGGSAVGHLSPQNARLGYWTWIIPTLMLALIVLQTMGHNGMTPAIVLRSYFIPNSRSLEWTIGTVPWIQSFCYAWGLRRGAQKREMEAERPTRDAL